MAKFTADVRARAKLCLLDALGAIIAGNPAVITGISEKFATRMWPGGDEATMLLFGRRSSAVGAAFVNAWAANALDIDDDGKYTEGHPGAQIIPVALAMAEKQGVTGQEALTAIVIGYEVAHRMGRCWHDDHTIYQACGSWGSVANAAIASRLLWSEPISHNVHAVRSTHLGRVNPYGLEHNWRLFMLQHIDEFSEWITYIKPSDTPRLTNRAIFNFYVRVPNTSQGGF